MLFFFLYTPQVDDAIAMCSEMHNIKDAVYENKLKLEGIGKDFQFQVSLDWNIHVFNCYKTCFNVKLNVLHEGHIFVLFTHFCLQGSSTKGYFKQRTLQSLERYVYLLVFNAYLHDQVLLTKFYHIIIYKSSHFCQNMPWFESFLHYLLFLSISVVFTGISPELQSVDVYECLDLQTAGQHGYLRTLSTSKPYNQWDSSSGKGSTANPVKNFWVPEH